MDLKPRYYACCKSIIEDFSLTMTSQQIYKNLVNDALKFDTEGIDKFKDEYGNKLKEAEEVINKIIHSHEGTFPYLIRYFSVPDFGHLTFRLCAAARVRSNGSTYLFTHDKEILEAITKTITSEIKEI